MADAVYYYDIELKIAHIKYVNPKQSEYAVCLEMKKKNIVSI